MNDTNFSVTFPVTISREEIVSRTPNIDLQTIYNEYIPEIFVFTKYAGIVLFVFGFPGNIFACLLWLQKSMLHSSGCYLAALAVSDVLFLIMAFVYDLNERWDLNTITYPIICQIFPCLYLSLQYLSPLLTLAFTIERFISIRFPFKRRIYCNVKRAVCVIFTLAAISLGISGIQVYFWEYHEHFGCNYKFELANFSEKWTWATECIMFMFVPVLILIFNILLVVTMKNSTRRAQELYGPIPPKQKTATTKMLLVVSFFFIFTTIPVSIVFSMKEKFPVGDFKDGDSLYDIRSDNTWQRHFRFVVVRDVIYIIGRMHYVCNFYLYIATGKRFRQAMKKLFRKISIFRPSSMKDRQTRSLRSSFTELRSFS